MQTCFSSQQLRSMKMVPNRVLVKPSMAQKNVSIGNGTSLQVDKRFANEKHAPVTGIIVNFSKSLIHEKMNWHTNLEIQVEDFCVYSYESAMYAMDEMHGRVFKDENDEQYFMIDYDDIFTVKRGDQIIPVNGYLLVSPVSEEVRSEISLPVHLASKQSVKFGIIEYIGTRNECYYGGTVKRTDTYDFTDELKKGDVVVFSQWSDLPLEFSIHKSIDPDKQFFRMQRRDLLAVL